MKRSITAAVAGITLTGVVGIGVAAAATGNGPVGRIAEVLSGLVSDGTLTQQQADAVTKALEDAGEEARAEREAQQEERQAKVDALLQDTLGLTSDQVRDRMRAGETLKEIAGDKADELAAAAMALVKEQAAAAVTDGKLTQEQADQLVARAQERADAWLAGEEVEGRGRGFGLGLLLGGGMGFGGHHGGHHGGPGWRGDWDDSDAGSTEAPSASATTTSA